MKKEQPIKIPKETPISDEFILTVRYNTTNGQIGVDGPLVNEMLCIWLLDKAKDICKAYTLKKNSSNIVAPHGGIMNFVRGKRF